MKSNEYKKIMKYIRIKVAMLMIFVFCISITGCTGGKSKNASDPPENIEKNISENDTGYYETSLNTEIDTPIMSYFVRKR